MKQNRYEAVLAIGLRGVRWLLMATGFALYVTALGVGRLADVAGRRAAHIRVR